MEKILAVGSNFVRSGHASREKAFNLSRGRVWVALHLSRQLMAIPAREGKH